MTLTAEITHPDSSTETLTLFKSVEEYEFEKMDIAILMARRSEANSVTLNDDEDEVELKHNGNRKFGGVLANTKRKGGKVELIVDSYERYAQDGERSGGGLRYENALDTDIYDDAISDIPQLSQGDVEQIQSSVTYIFSFASPDKRIRTTAEKTNAEIRFNADKTVDIKRSLGSDKTSTVLSPSNQNVLDEFSPERDGGEKHVTHLVMVGAGEGPAQVQVLLAPTSDSRDFESEDKWKEVQRYTAENWNDGDERVWDAKSNKNVSSQSVIADHGKTIIEEYEGDYIDVETVVEGPDVALGDEFTLDNPKENFNAELRAVKVNRIIDSDGTQYETTFSNRRVTRETDDEKVIKDTDRYNLAFEGNPVTLNPGGGRQPVTDTQTYDFSFYYPGEVEYEHRVNLFVKLLPFRAFSSGSASSVSQIKSINPGTTSTTTGDSSEFCQTITLPGIDEPYFAIEILDSEIEIISDTSGSYFRVKCKKDEYTVQPEGSLNADYELENIGDSSGTQDIDLVKTSDSSTLATDSSISLTSGERNDQTITYDPVSEGPGVYALELQSDDDNDAFDMVVEAESPYFTVDVTNWTFRQPPIGFPVDILTVDVDIRNIGSTFGTKDVEFFVDGDKKDTYSDLTLAGSEKQAIQFEEDTGTGVDQFTVQTPDDSETVTISGTTDGFEVEIIDNGGSGGGFNVTITGTN